MTRGTLAILAVLLFAAAVAVAWQALEIDVPSHVLRPDTWFGPAKQEPALPAKKEPSEGVFAIDPAKVSAVDYETIRGSWTAERMDAGSVFAVTISDVLGRVAKHCRADLDPVITGLAMMRVERLLLPEEAQNVWTQHGPTAAKVRLRGADMEDSIEFRVVFTEHVREAVVLRAGARMFVPSLPSEVFELLAEGCPRKLEGEEGQR